MTIVRGFVCLLGVVLSLDLCAGNDYVVRPGSEWVEWDDVKDIAPGSALDFSSLGLIDAPAGKYGWLRNVGGHFEFENRLGVPVRLAGANFCKSMNFPTHEESDRIVRRLCALGFNSIRLHHHDAGLVMGSEDNLTFNPEQTDRFDYLVAQAIKNGLYVTTDLYVSRKVTWRQIGVDRDGSPFDVPGGRSLFKLLIAFDEGAYANWKAFATNFMNHVNPYTGRRYAEEPGMPLICMVNEANYRMGWKALTEHPSFRAKWAEWAEEKSRTDPEFAAGADLHNPSAFRWNKLGRLGDTPPAAFLADTEAGNFARQLKDMRTLGAKALFTSINHLPYYAPDATVKRRLYGYFDDHVYIDHPSFKGKSWTLPLEIQNDNPLQDPDCRLDKHAYMKIEGLPATLSEFNFCGPNGYRGMGGLLAGAFLSGQDVSGYWRFAYSHGITNMYDRVGIPGNFDLASDPVNLAAERVSHLLYLRGDFPKFEKQVSLVLPDYQAATRGAQMPQLFPEWRQALTWKARVSCSLPGEAPLGAFTCDQLLSGGQKEPPIALPDAHGLIVDRTNGTIRLTTERTCGVSTAHGRLAAGPLGVDVLSGGFATTVAISSLDRLPIATSRQMLLTHLTDAQADGTRFADTSCKRKLEAGAQPILIRDGEVRVSLLVDEPSEIGVYGLNASGARTGRIETSVEDGRLSFTARVRGAKGARIYYELTREVTDSRSSIVNAQFQSSGDAEVAAHRQDVIRQMPPAKRRIK